MSSPRRRLILLADDYADDADMIADALGDAGRDADLRRVADGEELMDYLLGRAAYADRARAPWPDLVLLDLNMPLKDGRESLAEIRSEPALRRLPVVVLSTSSDHFDITESYEFGANSYLVKPHDYTSWIELMRTLCHYWFDLAALPRGRLG